MSQVAVLPHQTNGSSAGPASAGVAASQPDIGQLSLHAQHHGHHYQPHTSSAARRKSSFSSSSSGSTNSYRTMPLSRTRSLLANINGVANGANGSVHVTNGGSSTANTPGSEAGNGYALPSINGSNDHLPPLKANGVAAGVDRSGQAVTNGGGSVASNNNKFFNGSVNGVNGSSVNGVNGTSLTSNGYLHHDMDVISTTGSSSLQSTTGPGNSLTNGHLSHINGMQTLPHVRSSATSEARQPQQPQSAIIGFGTEEISDKDLFDNDKSQQNSAALVAAGPGSSGGGSSQQQLTSQQNAQQSAQQSQTAVPQTQSVGSQQRQQDSNQQNSVQQSPTNSSALSNNAVNAANNTGSLKPKTMVATPEQVRLSFLMNFIPYP